MTTIYDGSEVSSNPDSYFIEVSSYAEIGDMNLDLEAEDVESEEDTKDFPEHPESARKRKRKARTRSEDSCTEDSGMLSMLAEVASATLNSYPSVRKARNAKPKARGSVDPKKTQLGLGQIQNLTEKQLLELFTRSDADEIRRTFSYKCCLLPRCEYETRSFGGESKARQEMQKHLSYHVQELNKKARDVPGFKFSAVPVSNAQKKTPLPREKSPQKPKEVLKVKLQKAAPVQKKAKPIKKQKIARVADEASQPKRMRGLSTSREWEDLQSSSGSREFWDKMYDGESLQLDNVVAEEVVVESEPIDGAELNILPDHDYNIYAASKKTVGSSGQMPVGSDEQMRAIAQSVAAAAQEKLKPQARADPKGAVPINKFMLEETTNQGQIAGPKTKANELLPCVGSEVVVGYNPNEFYIMKSADLPVIEDLRQKSLQPQPLKDPLAIDLDDFVGEVQAEVYIEDEDQLLEAVAAQARDQEEDKDYFALAKRRAKIQPKFVTQSAAERDLALQYINEIKQHRGGGAGLLECKICVPARSFTAPTTLLSHYRSHAGIKPYECRRCGAVFTRQHSLNYHMLIHANMSRFTCPDCNRQFRHPSHYKEHRRRHTGEAPYECSDCMQRFRTRNSYKRHLMTRHGKLLTSDGGLIILPEEEFKKVRCKPRARKRSGNQAAVFIAEDPELGATDVPAPKKGGGRRKTVEDEGASGSSYEQQRQEDLIRLLYQRLTSSTEAKDEENASLESSRSCSPIPGLLAGDEEHVTVDPNDVAAAVVVETMPGSDEQVIEEECEVAEEEWDPSFINLTVDGQNNVIFLDDHCQDAAVVVEPEHLEVQTEVDEPKTRVRTESPAEIDLLSFVHNAGVMVQHILDIQPNGD